MRRGSLILLAAVAVGGLTAAIRVDKVDAAPAVHTRKVCGDVAPHVARCFATMVTGNDGVTPLTGTPAGYGPADFRAAYGNQGTVKSHIAVVVAYDAPHIQADLTTFSKQFGLPSLPTCTTTAQTSCFEKFNQRGTTAYPRADSSWALEASMDVETAHGQCPSCRISLIEADSPSMDNLAAAAAKAASLGAKAVSNSYGGAESSGEAAYDRAYQKNGVTMLVSSGDNGYGSEYPAASPYVVAVGGTSLHMNSSRVTSETAWDGSGSGCSQFEYKPSWQHDKKCVMRSIADIAADADPATGAAIYDSLATDGRSGWFTLGGTSLAAPLVAGILAANGLASNPPATLYSSATIRDITGGSNGNCSSYLCRAAAGYDGPTGLGVLSHP